MAHLITELDAGILEGNQPTWHGMPQYKLVGDTPITVADVEKILDYEVKLVPTYIKNPDDTYSADPYSQAVVRVLSDGKLLPLCRAVGRRYSVLPRKQILHQFDEGLLAKFPDLKIAGAGTFGSGQTFFMQLRVEDYHIAGDQSDHQLRLSYSDSYGDTAHKVFVTGVRIVCNNTLHFGIEDAKANEMFSAIRHTASATMKVEAQMELFAKLHLGLVDQIEQLEELTRQEVDQKYIDAFLTEMFPLPEKADEHPRLVKHTEEAKAKTIELFESSSDTMDQNISASKYALLQAFTDVVDHHVYYRSPGLRWQQSLDGVGAALKDKAMNYLAAV